MTDQPALFTDPPWTARFVVGATVRDVYLGQQATVVAVDPGERVRVRIDDHPYHGTYECTYGMASALEPIA